MNLAAERRVFQAAEEVMHAQELELDRACGDDTALREAVARILAREAESSVVEASAGLTVRGADVAELLQDDADGGLAECAGRRLGAYRLLRKIGEGGMGQVFLAEQDEPRREVAIKVLKLGLLSEQGLARFRFEAESLARLDHPGIARVLEFGVSVDGLHGLPFLVMESIAGVSLLEHVRTTRASATTRLGLLEEVARAVQHAHQRGVIHRDLKPQNVLVDRSGRARLVDFGVARPVDPAASHGGARTLTGQVLGSLPYMSPEQRAGVTVDVRSDVFALGVTACEVLTGALPTPVDDEPLDLSAVRAVAGREAEAVLRKAMAPEPDARYASAAALADDLQALIRGDRVAAPVPGAVYRVWRWCVRRRRALSVALVTVALLVLLAQAWYEMAMARQVEALRSHDVQIGRHLVVRELPGLLDLVAVRGDTPAERHEALQSAARLGGWAGLDVHVASYRGALLETAREAYGVDSEQAELALLHVARAALLRHASDEAAALLAPFEERPGGRARWPGNQVLLDCLRLAVDPTRADELDASVQLLRHTASVCAHGSFDERVVALREAALARELANTDVAEGRARRVFSRQLELAGAHWSAGDLDRALAVAEVLSEAVPPGHEADALNLLGVLHRDARRFDEALVAFEESLRLREQAYAEDPSRDHHTAIMASRNNIARLHADQGDWRPAFEHFVSEQRGRLDLMAPGERDDPTPTASLSSSSREVRRQFAEAEALLGMAEALVRLGGDPAYARELATVAREHRALVDWHGHTLNVEARSVQALADWACGDKQALQTLRASVAETERARGVGSAQARRAASRVAFAEGGG